MDMNTVSAIAVITGILASLIGSVLALLGVYRYKVKEAEEKGHMNRQFIEVQEDLGHAHSKIRELQQGLFMLEKTGAMTTERLNSVDSKVDESNKKLDRLLELHIGNRDH